MPTKQQLEQIFGEIQESKWVAEAKQRNENRNWIIYSQEIALAVLELLDLKSIGSDELAEMLSLPPQLVNKWLTGNEKLTPAIISKLEKALEIKFSNT